MLRVRSFVAPAVGILGGDCFRGCGPFAARIRKSTEKEKFPMSASDSNVANDYGSVERGTAGDYQFSIEDVLREAWAKTDGSKA